MKIVNGRIGETFLGFENHNILTFWLMIDKKDSTQGYGGWSFSKDNTELGKTIYQLLKTFSIVEWKDLVGTYVRVKYDSDQYDAPISAIGHITLDQWFSLTDLLSEVEDDG